MTFHNAQTPYRFLSIKAYDESRPGVLNVLMSHSKISALNNKKKRSLSSRQWLLRQLNDPYVAQAKEQGYRSRAAFKLLDIDRKFHLFKPGQTVIDLGCAPGGWLQVLRQKVAPNGRVIGLDLQNVAPLENVTLLQGDFMDEAVVTKLEAFLKADEIGEDPIKPGRDLSSRWVDVVVSDMAAAACGIPKVDYIRIMELVRSVFLFSQRVLGPGGSMVAKVLRGGTETGLLKDLKQQFHRVSHFKPASSRADSAEIYLIAQNRKI